MPALKRCPGGREFVAADLAVMVGVEPLGALGRARAILGEGHRAVAVGVEPGEAVAAAAPRLALRIGGGFGMSGEPLGARRLHFGAGQLAVAVGIEFREAAGRALLQLRDGDDAVLVGVDAQDPSARGRSGDRDCGGSGNGTGGGKRAREDEFVHAFLLTISGGGWSFAEPLSPECVGGAGKLSQIVSALVAYAKKVRMQAVD